MGQHTIFYLQIFNHWLHEFTYTINMYWYSMYIEITFLRKLSIKIFAFNKRSSIYRKLLLHIHILLLKLTLPQRGNIHLYIRYIKCHHTHTHNTNIFLESKVSDVGYDSLALCPTAVQPHQRARTHTK